MSSWRDEIASLLDRGKGFEVVYEDGRIRILEVKGVSKGTVSPKEIKGVRKARVKPPPPKLKNLIIELSEELIKVGKKFKVTLGQGDFILRFDLDHYVRVDLVSSSVVGFENLNEEPIRIVADLLKSHGEVRILKPLR
ncbi:MAG: hypothetical protein N3F04_01985 [Candidatus Nezhaarchaeota archaeon]|nr:hypothetical protein [Candidatus Nezhaarchaeota archaeon]MCX8141548.1 hypothetical protein [Candidatus Nezhaarchaeota archaeon]MDW8049815.1 hypothetical protein [Nitrososphaerota archaeon]